MEKEFIGRDILHELYLHTEYPYGQRPPTELDHYLQEARPATGESSLLRWWKEHCQTYPTIGRMAHDILALPCSNNYNAATRIARFVISESGNTSRVEELVCIQDWLTPAGMTCALASLVFDPTMIYINRTSRACIGTAKVESGK
jgi:hypothetical protein